MGYYDDQDRDDRYYDGYGRNDSRSAFGFGKTLFISFISAVIGGLVVMMLMPVLVEKGYIQQNVPLSSDKQSVERTVSGTPGVQYSYEVSVNSAIVDAVAKVEDAVVGVINIGKQYELFSRDTHMVEQGTGSGVVFSRENGKARIVTNYHVIKGASNVEVSLSNGERVPALVVGKDELTDLAIIEINDKGASTVAEFGSSARLKVGEPVVAIGNPLGLKFSRTVTQGIISSTDRAVPLDENGDGMPDWELDVIQTDAAINPGNSGGALINVAGQVIGINSLKISEAGVEGLGFAIPSDDVLPIINDLVKYQEVRRAAMGIEAVDLQEIPGYHWTKTLHLPEHVNAGVMVNGVSPMGPADKAGLERFDVIVKLDDKTISSSVDLRKYIYRNKHVGDTMKVTFYRGGELLSKDVRLGRL